MRVLIVKLSSLGDVVHAMPVVHDIRAALPQAVIDWVVEPGFAPLVRRVAGIDRTIACALRRWSKGWWRADVRAEWRAFRERLQQERYDAVIDLQGLTKSALIGRVAHLAPGGARYGLANRTEGASHEAPARWLVDHAIRIAPRVHALDRSRELAARALGYGLHGAPQFGLQAHPAGDPSAARTVVFVHGTSRDDKLWPEASWIEIGQRLLAQGLRIALPHAGAVELERAQRIASALGDAAEVWPAMTLDALVDRLGGVRGVVGVDSGLSHIAVALDLPHVQIYNFPTAWRTGPQPEHGHRHQVSVEARPTPSVEAVWGAWQQVQHALLAAPA
ncbi:MAG TPA: lipopolysaccharide heptosyltransferase I [Burkholderiaceae bacterium]|nr:lipopolysaccharide heptosyltransferase I [Burkholderiaceae bacterium]